MSLETGQRIAVCACRRRAYLGLDDQPPLPRLRQRDGCRRTRSAEPITIIIAHVETLAIEPSFVQTLFVRRPVSRSTALRMFLRHKTIIS
jgi:hypothetical protein